MADLANLRRVAYDRAKQFVPGDTRMKIMRARLSVRQASARWRGLPDVLVIGAMRSGTSSMYKYLGYHPSVAPSLRKEVEYFTRYFDKPESWYRSHFPLKAREKAHSATRGGQLVTFEASPYYLLHRYAPERAAALVPDARIVVMLRDPVARAFSHWQHMVRHDIEKLPFEEAIATESERLAPEIRAMTNSPLHYSKIHYHFSYLARSRYAEQLPRWLDRYPSEQFVLVNSDALYSDPAGIYGQLIDHLGLPAWELTKFDNYSYLGADFGRADTKLTDEMRAQLTDEFAEDQAELAKLIATHGLRTIGMADGDPPTS